ncbi:MAG: outer membrane lipoprotein-sorting protein, partial [Myxococcota bacterium]
MLSLISALCFTAASVAHADPSADELLAAVDENMISAARSADLEMTVAKGSRVKVYVMDSFSRGEDEAAVAFNAPARDKGTKMLKRGGELWMYMPSIEKTQKISGHMLRQSMMGSDLSYEDILQATQLRELYTATVVGAETMDGRECWKLELTAKDDAVAYPRRVSWIDQEHTVPVREELYALSGTLLKTWSLSEVQQFADGRSFPTRWLVEDRLQAGSQTTLVFRSLDFT